MKKILLVFLFFYFVCVVSTFSQIYSVIGINLQWSSPSSWVGGVAPSASDTVYIPVGSGVIIDNMLAYANELMVAGRLDLTSGNLTDLHVTHSLLVSGILTNNGKIFVDDNYYNHGFTGGNGAYCVSDITLNDSTMAGSFDFCDLTPPGLPPYVDMNTGTIGTGITYCMAGLCAPARVLESNEKSLFFITRESSNTLVIHLPLTQTPSELQIVNATGSVIYQRHLKYETTVSVSEKQFSSGLYFVVLTNATGTMTRKIFIE